MKQRSVIAILAAIAISLVGLTVFASTRGWGVDEPADQRRNLETSDPSQSRLRRRTYHNGHYFIYYRSHGIRNTRSARPGGSFHSGK